MSLTLETELQLREKGQTEMARNSNSSEVLVPVESVVAVTGYPLQWVWSRLDEREIETDWDGSPAVRWSVAKKLADDCRAAKEENDRLNVKMREEQAAQIERERAELQREAAEQAAANPRRVLRGVEVSVPGDPHTPNWMKDE
jgi:hypothetical protein